MAPQPKPIEPAAGGLAPGVSFFQVLTPQAVRLPNGDFNYAMAGPFLDLLAASHYANARPGSLIQVSLVLHQVPHAAAPAAAPAAALIKPAR